MKVVGVFSPSHVEEDWVVTLPLLKTREKKAWQPTPGFDAEQLEP